MIKPLIAILCAISGLALSLSAHAQNTTPIVNQQAPAPLIQWTSNSSSDTVKIENGSGANLSVQITVIGNEDSPGIMIQNCGATTALKAGSSAICTNKDAKNPITFSSDSPTSPASGTYQITQQ